MRDAPEEPPWQDLKQRLVALLRQARNTPADRCAVLRILAEDRWFQAELCFRCRTLRSMPADLRDDVQQEAMLELDKRLRKHPDLRIDYARVDETFPYWMGVIVERACRNAATRIRSLLRKTRQTIETDAVISAEAADLAHLAELLQRLHPDTRALLELYAEHGVAEAARRVGLSYQTAYRRVHWALGQLRRGWDGQPLAAKTF